MQRGSVPGAGSSSAAAKASARTTSDVDLVVLAYVAGQEVPLEDAERNAALRRALFVFAAGGPLSRDPGLDDPAVSELAGDIDSPERRAALAAAIERLDADPEALERLRDPDTAWRAYSCGLLADALGEEEDDA
jgi:hypothetical protein